jgi:hypothetical protein
MNKIKMAKEIMEVLMFVYPADYGRKFREMRESMTLEQIHVYCESMIGGEL